jgi:ribosomal protein S27AE
MSAEPTIQGHPAIELDLGNGQATLITVCASCGQMRTILFLSKDRWFCTKCRAEGAAPPNLYPVA